MMTDKEKEIRKAVSKVAYFQGTFDLRLIDYLEKELPEKLRFDVRSKIDSDLLQKLDELDSFKYKEDVTVEEVNSHIMILLRDYKSKLHELQDRLNELFDWTDV